MSFFILPRSPTTSRFLTQEEKDAVTLVISQEWMNGEEEAFTWSAVWSACKSPHIIIFTILAFFNGGFGCFMVSSWIVTEEWLIGTAVFGLAFLCVFLYTFHVELRLNLGLSYSAPSIVAGLGYTKTTAQLTSVPPYACSFVGSLLVAYLSDRYQQRGLAVIFAGILATVGYGMYLGSSDYRVGYASLFFQTTGVFITAPTVSVWYVSVDQSRGGTNHSLRV